MSLSWCRRLPARTLLCRWMHLKDLGKGKIAVQFRLPRDEQAYGVRFVTEGGELHATVSLNPYTQLPASAYVLRQTASVWLLDGKRMALRENLYYFVYLLFAHKRDCKTVDVAKTRGIVCKHIEQSGPVEFHLGSISPPVPVPAVSSLRILKRVWISALRLHATYRLPATMVPYKIQFYSPASGAYSLERFDLLPGGRRWHRHGNLVDLGTDRPPISSGFGSGRARRPPSLRASRLV